MSTTIPSVERTDYTESDVEDAQETLEQLDFKFETVGGDGQPLDDPEDFPLSRVENAQLNATERPQKAVGMQELKEVVQDLMATFKTVRKPSDIESVAEWAYKNHSTIFARPCPVVPNHGQQVAGIESQRVPAADLGDELEKWMRQFHFHGCDGVEVIVMPKLQGSYSAVLTPSTPNRKGQVVLGKGHDGVTAGTSQTVAFPLPPALELEGELPDPTYYDITAKRAASGLFTGLKQKTSEDPSQAELEVVSDKGLHEEKYRSSRYVQLRRAPEHQDIGAKPSEDAIQGHVPEDGFIPDEVVTVEDIQGLEALDDVDGNVLVLQPDGSLLSHAAAHARSNGWGFLASDVEDAYAPRSSAGGWAVPGDSAPDIDSHDPADYEDTFWEGLRDAKHGWHKKDGWLGLHFHTFMSQPVMDPETTAYLAGRYVGWLVYAGMAACIGELRHIGDDCELRRSCEPSDQEEFEEAVSMLAYTALETDISSEHYCHGERSVYYETLRSQAPTLEGVAVAMERATWHFRGGEVTIDPDGYVRRRWDSAMGGEPWRACARAVQETAQVLADDGSSFDDLLEQANRLENVQHNNDQLHTKFVSSKALDMATEGVNVYDLAGLFRATDHSLRALGERGDVDERPDPLVPWTELPDLPILDLPVKDHLGQQGLAAKVSSEAHLDRILDHTPNS